MTALGTVAVDINPNVATARTHELVETAAQVADTILVTPALVHGDGEVVIRLKPTVLEGSDIHIEAKGSKLNISFLPSTTAIANIMDQTKVQFESLLHERLPSFQIVVAVVPRHLVEKKALRDETA